MSKKYGIYCEYCNVLLNNEDDNIFGTNFGQLYHFTCMGGIAQGKSTDSQPLTLFKMNLKFGDTPTITTEAEREIMVLKNSNNAARQYAQQLKANIKTLGNALLVQDRLKDDVNKPMDYVVDLECPSSINVVDKAADIVNNTSQDKSKKQAYDENHLIKQQSLTGEAEEENIEHNNSEVLQSAQQLEARIKTLEDALLQTKSDGNKLKGRIEALEKIKAVDTSPDGGNNITQDPKANKQTHNENNLTGEQHNDTENVASASEEHRTCTISEEKQEVLDLRGNCVLIWNPQPYSGGLNNAFSYVRKLANEMNAQIADKSIIHIDIKNYNLYVYFRDAESKFEFLKNRFIFKYNPREGHYLRIFDYSNYGIVDIENFQSSDLCSDTAFVNVLGLAKKMGMKNIRSSIDHIDVYFSLQKCVSYSVRFNCQDKKNEFLQNKYILKEFPETKSLEISDVEGHTLSCVNLNNFNMAIASANVIGIAELMGLSLSTADFKRIYVLNPNTFDHINKVKFSLVVEFSNNDIKHIFLNEKSELKRIGKDWSSDIKISDIKTEGGNIVSIKYCKDPYNVCTAISFIGLAKQLGFSFTSDQIDRFIELSEFISNASA